MTGPREPEARLEKHLAETCRQLAEAVQQQAATSQILAVIGRSDHELEPVFETVLNHAIRLCQADSALVWRLDGDVFRVATTSRVTPELREYFAERTVGADDPGSLVGRVSLGAHPVHIPDVLADHDYTWRGAQAAGGYRTMLGVPIVAPTGVVGVITVQRDEVRPFSAREIEVVSAFAAQGAIAIENVRLFRELDEKSRQLEIASRHKSEFLASMSHELRTPLNAVIGFSDVLLRRMFGDINERQEEYIRDIRDSGRHLLELLNEILDLSKVEAGRMELELSPVHLASIVEHGVTMIRERALSHGIEISVDIAPDVGVMQADELRMKQVVMNLLTNAVKFTPDGGVITVVAERIGEFVEVKVRDTGVGIPAGDQERIFDAFQQGARNGLAAEEGTGLGLTLTKRIVELHGGRMHLTSRPGEGSTFTLCIPTAGPAREPGDHDVALRDEAADMEAAGPAVLVVEDDARSLELLRLYLNSGGFRVIEARDGDAALTLAAESRPTAIILDIMLPGRDGWNVLAELKQNSATGDIPVIVASMLDEKGRGFALGAAEYLVKPISQHDVLTAVRRCAPGHEAPDAAVVVIDDDPTALALARAILEPEGYRVISADNGETGVMLVRQHQPAVVLVDLLMPGVDGFDVIEQLRSSPETGHIPILVLTAKTMTDKDRERLRGQIAYTAAKGGVDGPSLVRMVRELAPVEGSKETATWPTS